VHPGRYAPARLGAAAWSTACGKPRKRAPKAIEAIPAIVNQKPAV
jgi:hypothetical protein